MHAYVLRHTDMCAYAYISENCVYIFLIYYVTTNVNFFEPYNFETRALLIYKERSSQDK